MVEFILTKLGLALVLCLSIISATCNSTQVNINTASLTELDKISQIGPVLSQRIIDSRPFSSVDDLLNVSGIGNKTLEKIKQQGLACVTDENEEQEANETAEQEEINNSNSTEAEPILEDADSTSNQIKSPTESKAEIINLSLQPKDIKSKKLESTLEKFPIYGLIAFSLLLGLLFLIRKFKKRKSEFD